MPPGSPRATRSPCVFRARGLLPVALLVLVGLLVPAAPAGAGEVSLRAYFDNVGIAQDPTSGANFDGGGASYSSIALLLEGVRGGEPVTADGMTFTWPDSASGEPDNLEMGGQTVPVLPPEDATRLGLLGASHHGPVTAAVTLHYAYVDDDGAYHEVEVQQPVSFGDWTLNAGAAEPPPTNTVAVEARFRVHDSYNPETVSTYAFATSVPLDPDMTLLSVEFPAEPRMHLFGMTVL